MTLISFAGIAIFGIFAMAASGHHSSFNTCLGSLTQGVSCPNNNPTDSVAFHLNSFKFFSSSPLVQNTALLLYTALVFILAAWVYKKIKPDFSSQTLVAARDLIFEKIFQSAYPPFKQERIFWNSLHENSPSSFMTQV